MLSNEVELQIVKIDEDRVQIRITAPARRHHSPSRNCSKNRSQKARQTTQERERQKHVCSMPHKHIMFDPLRAHGGFHAWCTEQQQVQPSNSFHARCLLIDMGTE
jgi:hypothetical protein